MRDLDKKQKIVVIAILVIIAGAIIYYVSGNDAEQYKNEILPYEENIIENTIEKTKTAEMLEAEKEEEIIIYIAGEVNKEGVYSLPEDSRIADAIEQAEGLTEDAYTEDINLAYKLEDGMKIKIPNKSETQKQLEEQNANIEDSYITTESGASIQETQTKTSQKVNINTASQQELETLTGVGPSIASKIVEYRKQNGLFKTIDDIKNVSGIGDNKFESFKDEICVK